jgi:SAM-dependent methyltransferase
LVDFVLQDVFEDYADDYDRWFDEHHDEYLSELARIRRVLPPPDSRAIEVGAGSGRFAAPLGITLGIEPSLALCRMARRRGIEIVRGRAEALPFKDGSCSSVLMVTVLYFLDNPVQAFQEIKRVLVPQGTLAIGFIEREGLIARRYLEEKGKHRFLSRARFSSFDEVLGYLRDTGFRVLQVESHVGFCVIAAQKV